MYVPNLIDYSKNMKTRPKKRIFILHIWLISEISLTSLQTIAIIMNIKCKIIVSVATVLIAGSSKAYYAPLMEGYMMSNNQKAPKGDEWNNPGLLGLNKEMPRAWFFSFDTKDNARKVLPEHSVYWKSLDGVWKFHFAKSPDARPEKFYRTDFDDSGWDDITVPGSWNVQGINKQNGSRKYGSPIYVNQWTVFHTERKVDDWRKGVMRDNPTNYTAYEYPNEVGSYRRTFDLPEMWDGREVYISFDGVDSFFYLWVNGQYVGFSKNSRNAARFNITRHIKKGRNEVAVEVYRLSDGSFLEAQDMFRLPGIFRTVAVYSLPKVQVRDLIVKPNFDMDYRNGMLNVEATVRNLTGRKADEYRLRYWLYANNLYQDDNTLVNTTESALFTVAKESDMQSQTVIYVANPKKWSAEEPNRYTLVAELIDKKDQVVETVSTIVGFRKVEIKDTPAEIDEFGKAGRYYYINGKTVKLKGVNRHETNPALGHAITRDQMEKEVMLMKQANINHVRNSHYPDAPYWYYLCNKYGIYLEDEANIESHEYGYGPESLSHPEEWRPAHIARVMEMAHSDVNNPSIVIWSLGNEAGPGHNFKAAYDSLKHFDTSRPVQYERNNDIVDMGSNQYPSVGWTKDIASGNKGYKYPYHISEYAHSMGNAVGNLADIWSAVESSNFICGGAIWDWVDQGIWNYTPDGQRYMGYGGDFGDSPNDGQFVMNGIMFGDLEPKPQYYEVKKVYQNIVAKMVDVETGEIEIFNKNYFIDLTQYLGEWSLWKNGKQVNVGEINLDGLTPRTLKKLELPYDYEELDPEGEYFIKLQFILKHATPWADAGYVQAEEQFPIKAADKPVLTADNPDLRILAADSTDTALRVKGQNFSIVFNTEDGSISSLKYDDINVIVPDCGPRLNAFRAFTNNDNWFYSKWFTNGLHNLKHKAIAHSMYDNKDGSLTLAFTVRSQAPNSARQVGGTDMNRYGPYSSKIEEFAYRPFGDDDFHFTTRQLYTIHRDGSIELQANIQTSDPTLVLPRLGYQMQIPNSLSHFDYYGRGPVGNYNDRRTGSFIERYSSTVRRQVEHFPKPQEMANHEETRWCSLTNPQGEGVLFVADGVMSVQALPFSAIDMTTAAHPYELPKGNTTFLNLDLGVTGLGGTSCGQAPPFESDRVMGQAHSFGFIIRPIRDTDNRATLTNVRPSSPQLPLIQRDGKGDITITGGESDSIVYTIDGGKPQGYTGAFPFKQGGTVTAWPAQSRVAASTAQFDKISAIQIKAIFASSEENKAEDTPASNLTDGDPSTFWHTMYSVTMAGFPHWVDFDCMEVKNLTGFTYLPRQGSPNGNIKDYEILVSQDGNTWSEPVARGTFANNQSLKKVMFAQPVKARYLRFRALSNQAGNDYATGAEFTIMAE